MKIVPVAAGKNVSGTLSNFVEFFRNLIHDFLCLIDGGHEKLLSENKILRWLKSFP